MKYEKVNIQKIDEAIPVFVGNVEPESHLDRLTIMKDMK